MSKPQPIPQPPSDAELWFDLLPKPPRPFGEQSEQSITDWMHACVEAAEKAHEEGRTHGRNSIAALEWLWRPENWPYGPGTRSRLQHIRGQLFREIDELTVFRREREANERIERLR